MSDTPVLEVRDLRVGFHSGRNYVDAVDGIDFYVRRGETLVILGESGSGKSVSASVILDLLDIPPAEISAGEVLFHHRNLLDMPPADRRAINGRRIAMIFQDSLAHLNPVYTVGWQVAEVFRAHNEVPAGGALPAAIGLLERVGIPDAAERAHHYPHQFSGGQRQRVMIAMALALNPELLVADEPTTALDATIQKQILELLRDLQAERGMSLVMITHDLAVAASVGDRVAVMHRGRIVETGPVREVFEKPRHAYTRELLAAAPRSVTTALPASVAAEAPLLAVRDLAKTYRIPGGIVARGRDVAAVRGVSFTLCRGETLAVVGESGSGKSTVARLLVRLNEPTGGTALYRGRNIFEMSRAELLATRRRIQMVFQDPNGSLNPRMSVEEIVAESWAIHGTLPPRPERRRRVGELLELVGMEPSHALRYPHQFSGGQRQRIAIARALASEPELLICDEAVSALDVSKQAQIIDLLADLRERLGLSFIFITHDLAVARAFAHRVLVMRNGEIVEEGPVETIFGHPSHPYTKQLLDAVPTPKWDATPGTGQPAA